MPKNDKHILTQCPYQRDSKKFDGGNGGYCSFHRETPCIGEVQFCKKPEALKEYLSDRGLGWQRKKRKNSLKKALQVIDRLIKSTLPFLSQK